MTFQSESNPNRGSSVDPTLTDRRGNRRRKRRTRIIAIIVILAILGSALAALAIARTLANQSNQNSIMTISTPLEPTSLDIRSTAGAALDQLLIGNIYEGLTVRTADNSVDPGLATDWNISSDGLTYLFTLVSGAKFSNGDVLTANEAAWSINDVLAHRDTYVEATQLAKVTGATAVDATHLQLKLSAPSPDLLWSLSGRSGLVLDPAATNDLATTAVGSGPFLLSDWKQGDSITLTRNDSYWGTKANLQTVVIRYITDTNAQLNALNSGDVDALAPITDATLLSQISRSDVTETVGNGSDKFVLAFNNQRSPLTDARVRQAIRYGIDNAAIIQARGGVDTLLGGPIPSGDPGYTDLTSLYSYDPTKAKALLAAAGYASGLTLKLVIPSFYGTALPDLLTSQLATVGITLQVTSVEFSTWLSQVYTNHDYDLSIVDHAESHDFGAWANPGYYFGYNSAIVQDLYAKAEVATDDATYQSLLAQAARIVSEDAAADWLFQFHTVSIVSNTVHNFPTGNVTNRMPLAAVTKG